MCSCSSGCSSIQNTQAIGPQGPQGVPGQNGTNGTNGSNGINGASVIDIKVNSTPESVGDTPEVVEFLTIPASIFEDEDILKVEGTCTFSNFVSANTFTDITMNLLITGTAPVIGTGASGTNIFSNVEYFPENSVFKFEINLIRNSDTTINSYGRVGISGPLDSSNLTKPTIPEKYHAIFNNTVVPNLDNEFYICILSGVASSTLSVKSCVFTAINNKK